MREAVLARQHELRVCQAKLRRGDDGVVSICESWMPTPNSVQCVRIPGAPLLEERARFAFRDVEVRPLGQPA
jgi:hypothetical protein